MRRRRHSRVRLRRCRPDVGDDGGDGEVVGDDETNAATAPAGNSSCTVRIDAVP